MRTSYLRLPSAYLPIAMSLMSVGLIVSHIVRYGFTHESDEGTGAHLFQLLMAGQLPVLAYFAVRRLGENPVRALQVMALQLLAIGAAFGTLYVFEHH